VKAKAAAIGLVAATGFLLLVSLVVSAVLSALATWIGGLFPGTQVLLWVLNTVVSVLMITALFAAIYKVLPDRHMTWGDVLIGALVTAVLFTIGKTAIGWYLGSGAVGTSFGAASALVVVLVWIYYSSQIFLVGAEFTRAYAGQEGSHQNAPVPAKAEEMPGRQTVAAASLPTPPALRRPAASRAPVWPVVAAVAIGLLAQGGWRRRHRA
jgi:membrane protein